MSRWLSLLLLLAGCLEPEGHWCGEILCPARLVCAPAPEGDDPRCVEAVALEGCDDAEDGAPCELPGGPGFCQRRVCVDASSFCGNGLVNTGEGCDCGLDPDRLPLGCERVNSQEAGANCRLDCQPRRCGDSVIDPGEICDRGDNVDGDGCSADCRSTEVCGNGYVDLGEECEPDPGAPESCNVDCTRPRCGDTFTASWEECDCGDEARPLPRGCDRHNSDEPNLSPAPLCRATTCRWAGCGDAIQDLGEVCDDGNRQPFDGCSMTCDSDESCGNEVIDHIMGETCDDANQMNRDGCTQTCVEETLTWREIVPVAPAARGSLSAAFDPVRGVMVVVGDGLTPQMWDGSGWTETEPLPTVGSTSVFADTWRGIVLAYNEGLTWTWRGADWTFEAGEGPGALYGAALAFDSGRGVGVLFGGCDGYSSALDETWVWDGAWTKREPPVAPPGRRFPAAAYDPLRGRIVLFGGAGAAGFLADTWEWDGTSWEEKGPLVSPPPRLGAAMAFDVATGKTILFGGNGGGNLADTWTWDGEEWLELSPAAAPGARSAHALVSDTRRRRVILHGGYATTGLSDVWEWDGATWSERVSVTPPARYNSATAFDSARGVTVLFGGQTFGSRLGDTWELASGWTQRSVAGPSPRGNPGMAYDSARRVVVLTGGRTSGGLVGDTWEWDGATWSERFPTTPAPIREEAALGYDPIRGRVVLFGGMIPDGNHANETWEWDGTEWTKPEPALSPPHRHGAKLAFDESIGKLVLFGGEHDDTWTWDGATWVDISTAPGTRPPVCHGYLGLAWNPQRRSLVLVRNAATMEVWELKGGAWKALTSEPPIFTRSAYVAAFDPLRPGFVVFGGIRLISGVGTVVVDELWTLGYTGGPDPEPCLGWDGDDDTLVGCADPDCGPRCGLCGDGVCDPIESHAICPGDCPDGVCGDELCDEAELGACPGDCLHCGDGVREGAEECDDGDLDTGDGCTPWCRRE